MKLGYKYRIYPNKSQKQVLTNWLGQSRFIQNYFLNINNISYKNTNKFIWKYELKKLLPELKMQYGITKLIYLQFAILNFIKQQILYLI